MSQVTCCVGCLPTKTGPYTYRVEVPVHIIHRGSPHCMVPVSLLRLKDCFFLAYGLAFFSSLADEDIITSLVIFGACLVSWDSFLGGVSKPCFVEQIVLVFVLIQYFCTFWAFGKANLGRAKHHGTSIEYITYGWSIMA